jgi:hypothetical protein
MLHTHLEGVDVEVGSKVEGWSGLEVVLGQRWDDLLGVGKGEWQCGAPESVSEFQKPR